MALLDLKRVTDLFVEGVEVVVVDDAEDPLLLWMAKLNSFEQEECRRDGATARSRYVLALSDEASPEGMAFESRLKEQSREDIIEELLSLERGDVINVVVENVRSDPAWSEKVEIITRSVQDLPDDERAVVDRLQEEYTAEVTARVEAELAQKRADLSRDTDLEEQFRKKWRERRASDRFVSEYTASQVFYGLRRCDAKKDGTRWNHAECSHERALASIAEVKQLPGGMFERCRQALGELAMGRGDARFLGGQPSSSESSQLPEQPAASQPSSQEATQPEPVGT